MAIQAFIDDSMERDEVLVLAGYIASSEEWLAFSKDWQERLDHARWKRFKMAEIAFSGSERQMETAGWMYGAIEEHVRAFVSVAVDIRALARAVDEFGLRPRDNSKYLDNPYVLAFRAIQDFTIQYQHHLGITEPIDFIFDERSEKNDVKEGYAIFREWCREDLRPLVGRAPRFESDDDFLPLQAADLLAWHVRRHWLREGSITYRAIPVSWHTKREIRGANLNLDYEEIRRFLFDLSTRLYMTGIRYSGPMKITVNFRGLSEIDPASRDGDQDL